MTNMELKVETTKAGRMQEFLHRPSLQCTALLMKGNLQLTATATATIFGQYAVNVKFVRFTIMKLKYILTTLLVEYSTFRIYR